MGRGWKNWKGAFGAMLAYAVMAVVLVLLPLAPLLGLASTETRMLALLGIPLFVLITLPGRRNAARVMTDAAEGLGVPLTRVISGEGYGRKVLSGLGTTLLLLIYAAPGIAASVYAYLQYSGSSDAVTILMQVSKLGGGDIYRGILYLVLIYVACWIPLMVGCCIHAGTRYALACGDRSLLKKNRGGVMRTWLCSLAVIIPFVIALAVIIAFALPGFKAAIKAFQINAIGPMLKKVLWEIVAAAVLLLLPVVPLRHQMLAAHVVGLKQAAEKDA